MQCIYAIIGMVMENTENRPLFGGVWRLVHFLLRTEYFYDIMI